MRRTYGRTCTDLAVRAAYFCTKRSAEMLHSEHTRFYFHSVPHADLWLQAGFIALLEGLYYNARHYK